MNKYKITVHVVHDAGHGETLVHTTNALRDAGLDVWFASIEYIEEVKR